MKLRLSNLCYLVPGVILIFGFSTLTQTTPWTVPEAAAKKPNPVKADAESLATQILEIRQFFLDLTVRVHSLTAFNIGTGCEYERGVTRFLCPKNFPAIKRSRFSADIL